MPNASQTVTDLRSLDREIHRLKLRSKHLESKLDDSIGYLQENYSSLMMKSVLPNFAQKGGLTGSILQFILQNQRLQEKLSILAERVFDKASDGIEFLIDKVSPRMEEDSQD